MPRASGDRDDARDGKEDGEASVGFGRNESSSSEEKESGEE